MFKVAAKFSKIKLIIIPFLAFLILNAHGEPIVENEVEDLNLIISQFIGGEPNALFIMDVSGSMGRNFGGSQIGNWTGSEEIEGVVQQCERDFCGNSCNSDQERTFASHCAENVANITVCGRQCENGLCDTQDEFDNFITCLDEEVENFFGIIDFTDTFEAQCVFNAVCGNNNNICGETANNCNSGADRANAAAALEALSGLTQCSSIDQCINDGNNIENTDTSCNTPLDYDEFRTCMFTEQVIDVIPDDPGTNTVNENINCTATDDDGNFINTNCSGFPSSGSTRLDITLNVIFDFLDADNSLVNEQCDDPSMLFDGINNVISCQDYMTTPFRNVSQIVRQDGSPASNRRLPISGGQDSPLIRQLTDDDAEELNLRIRPLTYSGLGNWGGCTDQQTFRVAQGGFAGASQTSFRNVWRFFRRLEPSGGTPLAYVLGFDDNNGNGGQGGNVINDDALGVYRVELQTDLAVDCRPEFVIILTDGEDTCSGECDVTANSCEGSNTTNANRRSSIQAVNNLRTYYSRFPVQNRGETIKKEIHTFVIGLGIPESNEVARRTLNAMALAGGTHTQGIIEHTDPTGSTFGTVDINTVLPGGGSSLDPFRALATADGIDTNPNQAQMQNCLTPDENGSCSLNVNGSTETIFDNVFFNTGAPLPTGQELDGFAFFPDNAVELRAALEAIAGVIAGNGLAGVSPAAPQSGTSLTLRDRIFISILSPITNARLWQGRMGLFGFVDDVTNPGSRRVVRVPDAGVNLIDPSTTEATLFNHDIFNVDGSINTANASQFHWEAGKNLTERDINGTDPRNIFTVDLGSESSFLGSSFIDTSFSGALRYIGDRTEFTNSLPPEYFGISDNDVDEPIPAFCGSLPSNNFGTCNADCDLDITSQDCRTCVKECLRDRIVSFMSGNTDIVPIGDPFGGPLLSGETLEPGSSSIGIDCPNGETNTGSTDKCEVRLGDIFHSDPVVVGPPPVGFNDIGFENYRNTFFDRSNAVYVGANDGAVHSFHAGEIVLALPSDPEENPFNGADEVLPFFDEGTGWEMFAFIPPTFLPDSIAPEDTDPDLDKDPESHLTQVIGSPPGFSPDFRYGDLKTFVTDNLVQRSFFDGSPLIFEAFIDGYDNGIASGTNSFCGIDTASVSTPDGEIDLCGQEWHTLMVSGYRNGGGGYTALDITNAACVNPNKSTNTCDSIDRFTKVAPTFSGLDPRFADTSSTPEFPSHLWTLFDQDFGNTWSNPVPGRVRMLAEDSSGDTVLPFPDRWLLFVGGGLDPVDTVPQDGVDFGRGFYAIDAATGKIVYKFHADRMFPTSIANNQSANVNNEMKCDMAAVPGIFDLNNDSFVDTAYIGDTCGRLWRFDISQPIVVNNGNITQTGIDGTASLEAPEWTASIAYCAGTDAQCGTASNPSTPQDNTSTDANEVQPVYFAPTVVPDVLGRNHVILQTGSRRDPSNINEFGKLINFIDPFRPSFNNGGLGGAAVGLDFMQTEDDFDAGQILTLEEDASVAGLFNITGGSTINNQGEFIIEFPDNNPGISGEKGVGRPLVINRILIFNTFAPNAAAAENPCDTTSGVGRIFAVDYLSGEAAISRVPGAAKILDDRFNVTGEAAESISGISLAQGMPTESSLTTSRNSVIITSAISGPGGTQFLIIEGPSFPSDTQTLYWKELF